MERKFVGLKGIACVVVFVSHFVCAFLPGLKFTGVTFSNLNGVDVKVGSMVWNPLKPLWGGDFAVILFITLSCYFVMNKLILSSDFSNKASTVAIKRYPQLTLPIFGSCLMIYIFQKIGLLVNSGFTNLVGYDWLDRYYQHTISFWQVAYVSLFKVLTVGDNTINTVLWMFNYIFLGTFAAIIFALIIKRTGKKSFLPLCVFAVLSLLKDPFYLGFPTAALIVYFERVIIFRSKKLGVVSLLLAYVGSCFSQYINMPIFGNKWGKICIIIQTMSVAFLLLGFVLIGKSNGIKGKVAEYLDSVSFSVCLVHMPIICSFSCWAMKEGIHKMNYGVLCILVFLSTAILVLVAANLFNKYILKKCNVITEWIVEKFTKEKRK